MTLSLAQSGLRARAASLARSGAWPEVASLFGQHADAELRASPELVALRAESLMRTGQPLEAREWLAAAMPSLRDGADRVTVRRATNLLGAAHFSLGELDEARGAFERALDLGREDGDDLTVARATNNLAALANLQGERELALSLYHLALTAYQRLGNALGLAQSLHNLAITLRDLGRFGEADECERRAIEYARQAGSASLVSIARLGRAEVSLRVGDAALAEAGARHAARSFAVLGDPINEADALRLMGSALVAQGRHGDAQAALETAVGVARGHGAALIEAESLRAWAELCARRGDAEGRMRNGEAALVIFERLEALGDAAALRQWLAAAAPCGEPCGSETPPTGKAPQGRA